MTTNTQPAVTTPAAKRPVILTVAAILVLVLVLSSAGLALARNYGLLGNAAGFAMRAGGRRFTGNFPQTGQLPQGDQSGQPGTFPGDQNGTNGFQSGTGTRTFQGSTMFALTRVLRAVTLYLNIGLLIFGLLAAFGIWKRKKWGAVLAIIISALILLGMLPTLLRFNFAFFNWLTIVEDVVKLGLSVAVIVLLLLPAARKAYSSEAQA